MIRPLRPAAFALPLLAALVSDVAAPGVAAEIEPAAIGSRVDVVAGQLADGAVWTAPPADPGAAGPFTAFVFLGTECPMAQSYAAGLSALAADFRGRGVHVVGVMSNAQDDAAEIAAFARLQGAAFPLLHDPEAALADRFGATRTPEVFVLGPDRTVRYHGRIDDRLDRGANRGAALRTDLRDALEELTSGEPVGVPETPFTGCRIGRRPRPAAAAPDAPTFNEHVAPILHAKCAECHRPGQVAPFGMHDPAEVQLWAPTIAEAVVERRMPPWSADPRYGEWKHDLNLSAGQIAVIRRWAEAGAPLGGGEPPAFPAFPDGWLLGEPDLIVELPAYDVQPGEEDWWPHLSATVTLEREEWISAVEIMPGNPKVLHHLGLSFGGLSSMGQLTDDGSASGSRPSPQADGSAVTRRERFRKMLEARRGNGNRGGGRPGGGAFGRQLLERLGGGGAGGGGLGGGRGGRGGGDGTRGFLGAWAAGSPPRVYPEGVGVPIAPGPDGTVTFRAGMHYHPTTNVVETDSTRIGLHFGEGPLEKLVGMGSAAYLPIKLAPGEDNYETRASYAFDEAARIILFGPHMHFRGKDMTYIARYPDGTSEILLSVPRYNFNYQWFYAPAEPIKIPAGTVVEAIGHLDNSAANPHNPDPTETVRFGPESDDEMAVAIMMFVAEHGKEPPRPDGRKRLAEWLAKHEGEPGVYAGTGQIAGLIPVPAALRLTDDGRGTLVMGGGGGVWEIDLGELTWRGDRFGGELDNGYGPTTATGERGPDGRSATARVVVRTTVKNPFIRLWNRGIEFDGRLR